MTGKLCSGETENCIFFSFRMRNELVQPRIAALLLDSQFFALFLRGKGRSGKGWRFAAAR